MEGVILACRPLPTAHQASGWRSRRAAGSLWAALSLLSEGWKLRSTVASLFSRLSASVFLPLAFCVHPAPAPPSSLRPRSPCLEALPLACLPRWLPSAPGTPTLPSCSSPAPPSAVSRVCVCAVSVLATCVLKGSF